MNAEFDTADGALTIAIVSVMADAGLRRCEATALAWADIELQADGSGRLTIARSKTDQVGEGAVVALTREVMADLDRLAALRGGGWDSRNRVFGLGDGCTGHSGRDGMAQRMTRNGGPGCRGHAAGPMVHTRMVARYTWNEAAGEALEYL